MQRVLSLNNSADSFEKALTLCYYSRISNQDFYNNNEFIVFYGNNLPKKKESEMAHGSVSFYQKYIISKDKMHFLSRENLLKNKNQILEYLLLRKNITGRNWVLYKNNQTYLNYIEKIPVSYLCPKFEKDLLCIYNNSFPNIKFYSLYTEKNIIKIILQISNDDDRYSVYGLNADGTIGHYYLRKKCQKDIIHMCNSLLRCSVISGNSATFIYQISCRIGANTIVGYRNHLKNFRPNREYALNKLLSDKKTIIEPKNTVYNSFFDDINDKLCLEEIGNIALGRAYSNFINNNKYINEYLSELKPGWESDWYADGEEHI